MCSITCPIQVPLSTLEKKPPGTPSEQRCSYIVGNIFSISCLNPSIVLVGHCYISSISNRIWMSFFLLTLLILGPRKACIFNIFILFCEYLLLVYNFKFVGLVIIRLK